MFVQARYAELAHQPAARRTYPPHRIRDQNRGAGTAGTSGDATGTGTPSASNDACQRTPAVKNRLAPTVTGTGDAKPASRSSASTRTRVAASGTITSRIAVAGIAPGTKIVTWTEDCFDGAVKQATDLPSKVMPPGHDNPQTGPFHIEGAEPGDTIAVHILKLDPARDYAVSSFAPGFGALVGTDRTAILADDLPEMTWRYDVDRAADLIRQMINARQNLTISRLPFSHIIDECANLLHHLITDNSATDHCIE